VIAREEHSMGKTQFIIEPGVQQIVILREFDAPPEAVYRTHTDPELLVQWLGPRRLKMTLERFEPRDGGTWRYTHHDESGNAYGFHGVFHGTPSVNGITQTFEFEGAPGHVSLESVTFEDHDGKTLLRVLDVFQSVEDRDAAVQSGMEWGYNEATERLDELLARLAPAR
jgi:uncharacterized protein YndB with AHSA1/START domain